ncbi:protein kinase domain-containing protein [Marinospirillum alkaliphilum]|uniref:Sulfatase-modifying factor enzyme 1 n=1 Tax=Marinospirillum alkaliphilum DSM 21637 TaxID=1122209 RepID=A0A1K1Z9E8_9GAMM|nr:protein kinase [Marinospirillum alkaliphilum]SFX70734.1 Sulfatase-modifying factor enzyme 1 [Marinospirillum alkaliphilum DSM 21637]
MVDPKRILNDLADSELALPEFQVMLQSLLQQGAFSLEAFSTALESFVTDGRISPALAEKITQQLPDTQPDIRPETIETDDEAVTVLAWPQHTAADETNPEDEAPTQIAYPQGQPDSSLDDDEAPTLIAYPPTSAAMTDDEDEAPTQIAYPQGETAFHPDDDEDEAPTIINTDTTGINSTYSPTSSTDFRNQTQQTSGHHSTTGFQSTTGYQTTTGTTTSTSQRSWDLPGATSPQLQKLGPGSIIKDRFILDKVLGAGGMGKVFQARDLLKVEANDANPYVAMKVLTEDFKAHPQSFIALQREASRQQKLAHPNIATVYDFDRIGMTGTQVFITMELLVGKPLDTYIRKVVRPKGGLPFEEAFPIIQQLGAALSYAHQRGIVHSDFKPGNAFLCDDGTVKTLDFGIARAVNAGGSDAEKDKKDTAAKAEGSKDEFDAGSLGALTPAYASLEMLQGKDPSTQDDLYALACVAYELLTGYHPFNKKSAAKAREAKLVPGPVKGLKKRQMKGLIHGLAFEKEKRTPTVEQFLEELEGKANWHKNPWVLASAFTLVLGVAAYNPVMNQLDERHIQRLIADVLSGQPQLIENTINQLPQLDVNARNRVTENGREVLQPWFQQLINRAVNLEEGRYDFDQAEVELARMAQLYPDSAALNAQRNHLDLQRNRYIHQLSQQLNQALDNEWLLPSTEREQRSISEILSLVIAVAPQHALLEDPRIPDAYATAAQEAINLGDLEQARIYLDIGLARMSRDIDLINTQDRWQLAQDRQRRESRISQLREAFGEQEMTEPNLALFTSNREAIIELARLSPDDTALSTLAGLAQPLVEATRDENNGQPLANSQRELLLALGLYQPLIELQQPTEPIARHFEQLLNQPALTHEWEAEVRNLLFYLQAHHSARHPAVTSGRDRLAQIYLDRINSLEEERRYSLALSLLDRANSFRLNEPRLGEARVRIDQDHTAFLREREAAALQARINGLQGNLLVEARAREMEAAERTLSELRLFMEDNDPFLTITAADAMAEAYLELTENAGRQGNFRQAVQLADRGLEISPNDLLLQTTRERYLVEGNIEELNQLFRDSEHFDTPAAQRMVDEIRTFAPARYPDLERQYTLILTERILQLAETDRRQGESLATRAAILFPGSTRLAQLRAELAPPPWIEGRTARAALTTGRLSEARNILESSRNRLPDHPEVLDFEKDLNARIRQAEQTFAAFSASLDAQEFDLARTRLGEARQLWSDNPTYRGAIATLSERMAQQRWQGRILQRDVDIRTLRANAELTGADVSAQEWIPVESMRPCTEDLAGFGRRARAICFDMLHDRVRGPLMVVIPGNDQQTGFAISKYEVSNEDYNKYCFFSGQCPVNDNLDKDLPRTGLNIQQIREYTEWLSARTGHTYRLPTRDEWHHAAWAQGQQPPRDYNCRVRLGGQILKGDQINRVSTGHQNGWGLQNFIGNAQELVQQGDRLLAVGGSYQDPHAECGLDFVRNHSGAADAVTGFRLLLEEVQAPLLQASTNP